MNSFYQGKILPKIATSKLSITGAFILSHKVVHICRFTEDGGGNKGHLVIQQGSYNRTESHHTECGLFPWGVPHLPLSLMAVSSFSLASFYLFQRFFFFAQLFALLSHLSLHKSCDRNYLLQAPWAVRHPLIYSISEGS